MRARDLLRQIIAILLDHIGHMTLIASRDVRTFNRDGMRITITMQIEPVEGIAWNDSSSRLSLRSGQSKQERPTEA